MRKYCFILLVTFSCLRGFPQDNDLINARAVIVNGDTIPVVHLQEVRIYSSQKLTASEERRMTRLMKNVKVAYPYAKLAGIKMDEYEEILRQAPDDKTRKQIMKQAEDELLAQYGDELRNLTVTQGKILIKLVDRQTGESTYDIVADMRGEFRAFFYQAFAKLFGMDMKTEYDPEGEDAEIENVVRMIESGQL
jgi:hypothetical protein